MSFTLCPLVTKLRNSMYNSFCNYFAQYNSFWIINWVMCSTNYSLQSRRFLTETRRYIERGRHLEKLRKRLRGEGRRGAFLPSPFRPSILNPSTSPLKTIFDSSQFSGSINVQAGGITLFPQKLKKIMDSAAKYACFAEASYTSMILHVFTAKSRG